MGEVVFWIIAAILVALILSKAGKKEKVKPPPPRPPTIRQLQYIDDLYEQREATPELLALDDPETIEEASQMIEMLRECPFKRD